MKKHTLTKKILPLILTALLLILAVPFMASAAETVVKPLMAGQNTEVGSVIISDNGSNLTVRYEITESGWFLTQTNLYVGTSAPRKSAPGSFPYSHSNLYDTTDEFVLPIRDGTKYYIAAHAVVINESNSIGCTCPTLDEITAMLPASGNIYVGYPGPNSYFELLITNAGILNGTRPGWCIDLTHRLSPYNSYIVNFYSSLSTPPAYLTTGTDPNIDHPENLDLVNWVLNHDAGYTGEEVQNVIWRLIDSLVGIILTPHEQALFDAAIANGESFKPDFCSHEVMAIIAVPVAAAGDQTAAGQILLTEYSPECTPVYKSDTAWARGNMFWKTGWGSYFTYTP